MYDNMITIEEGFHSSVNIAYDLTDDQKIKNFIPTLSSIDIIEDILLSVDPASTQRARILIGAYGRGKSHVILVLLSLLFRKDNKGLFNNLMKKIKGYDENLYDYLNEYIQSDRKILPVVISGSSVSLTQSFMSALQRTLEQEDLSDVFPDTHFKAVINTIEKWESEYPDTYNAFISQLDEPVSEFNIRLKGYDVTAYDKFVSIYPSLTSGSTFNPFVGFDVVEVYEDVCNKIAAKGFDGIFVVYDEFSKYLESSIAYTSISDIKLLQDFAEKCNRSASRQMHLLLICHKDISNYIDESLPKEKVDGWRGVSGRFKHIEIQNNFYQIYEIIAAVINKDKGLWAKFLNNNVEMFTELSEAMYSLDIFSNSSEVSSVIQGCFPLHPISVFILPRVSEKVAQNERTLFTFLSAKEKNSLSEFLSKDVSQVGYFLTPDVIYDYFEPLFRKEPYTSDTHKIYKLAATTLSKIDDKSLEAKIIKLIALIYIVCQFEKMSPTVDVVMETFCGSVYTPKDINKALDKLIQKDCLVYLKRSNSYLKLKESSGLDIPNEIERESLRLRATSSLKDILNNLCGDNYFYPSKYNDDHEITRYFEFSFVTSHQILLGYDPIGELKNHNSDGIVVAVVSESEDELDSVKNYILSGHITNKQVLIILPKKHYSISDIAYEYAAVKLLRDNVDQGDEVLIDEYNIYIEDLDEVFSRYLNMYLSPDRHESEYFYGGEKKQVNRKAQFSSLLSDICSNIFYRTPIINNEAINKNFLSSTAINSRKKILNGILSLPLEKNLGLSGTGQEVSIMRSVLIRTGLVENVDTYPVFVKQTDDENINNILQLIRGFFSETAEKGKQTFDILYNRLSSPEYGIGMKKGIVPIFIAIVIREIRQSVTILYKGKEVKITGDLLNDINESPEKYAAGIIEWDVGKEIYINGIVDIFSEYITDRELIFNNLQKIVLGINHWYLSLPKYSREHIEEYNGMSIAPAPVGKECRQFINSIKQVEINPSEFLFSDIFKIFGTDVLGYDNLSIIKDIKYKYDTALQSLIVALILDLKIIFGADNPNVSLPSVLKNWYESLNPDIQNYLFPNNENRVLEIIRDASYDESQIVQKIAKEVMSLRIEDWGSDTITEFIKKTVIFKKTVEDVSSKIQSSVSSDSGFDFKLTFFMPDGGKVEKLLEKVECSKKADLLRNEIETSLEEMGRAISEQEKRQVLIDILEKMC